MDKIFIWYAWAIWCWKSPITNYISTKLWLPIFNTDSILSEVCEDLLEVNREEANKRVKERLDKIINNWISFIYDASIDRKWEQLREILIRNNYKIFIISIDLDKETLLNFYKTKSYFESIEKLEKVYDDHQKFLEKYWNEINIHIDNKNYSERLEIVYEAAKHRINKEK